jgi:replicative DNA helicase
MLESVETSSALPQNVEAERAVLGAVLIDNLALAVISPILRESDFFLDTHRRIYAAIGELAARSADDRHGARRIDRMGSIDRVAAAISSWWTGSRTSPTRSITRGSSGEIDPGLISGQKMTREGDRRPVGRRSSGRRPPRSSTRPGPARGGFVPLGEIAEHNLGVEEARRPGILTGLPTGFRDLDRLTSGLRVSNHHPGSAAFGSQTSFAPNIAQRRGGSASVRFFPRNVQGGSACGCSARS